MASAPVQQRRGRDRNLVRRAVNAGRHWLLNTREVIIQERDLELPIPEPRGDPRLTYRRCSIEDLPAFDGIRAPWPYWRKHYARRFRRGQICLGCFFEGRVVGFVWLAVVPEVERALGLRITPRSDEMYGFDLFVLPEYRSLQAGFGLVRAWLLEGRSQGKHWASGLVQTTNLPMLMLTRAVFGFTENRRVTSVQFFKRYGVIVKGGGWPASRRQG